MRYKIDKILRKSGRYTIYSFQLLFSCIIFPAILITLPLSILIRLFRILFIRRNRMRILYVSFKSDFKDGTQINLYNIVSNLKDLNLDIYVAAPDDGKLLDELEKMGIKCYGLKFSVLFPRRLKKIVVLRGINAFLRAFPLLPIFLSIKGIDLIHVNTLNTIDFAVAGRLLSIPIVWHHGDPMFGKRWPWIQFAFLHFFSDKIICVSEFSRNLYRDFVKKYDFRDKSVVVHNAVNVKEFIAPQGGVKFREELGIDESTIAVGLLGNVEVHKGIETYINTAKTILCKNRRKDTKFLFLIAGKAEIEYAQMLRKQVIEWGLADKIIFLGFRSDIEEIISGLDISVLPSTVEAFGRVIIESMLLGTPVIGSRSGGIPEIIEDGVSGFLTKPEDEDELAEKIYLLSSDKNLQNRFARNGYERVVDKFNMKKHIEGILKVYGDMIKKKVLLKRFDLYNDT
jgi:L-malate glycosyltransferase